MKKAMICQPMRGLTIEEIKKNRDNAVNYLNSIGYEVVNTYFDDFDESNYKNVGVAYLSKSLEALSKVDALYCCSGWEGARGCMFEHDIADAYDIKIIEERTHN